METVTIRELRLNFRAVKRKVEKQGAVVITDNGAPSYLIQALPAAPRKPKALPDFYARLVKQQPRAMSAEAAAELDEFSRGER